MKYILPICLAVIIGTQLFDYFVNGEFNALFIAIACFLTPAAIKGIKPEFSKTEKFTLLSKFFLIIGIIILVLTILW